MAKAKAATKTQNEDIEVILEDSCETVSGKSELIFNLGSNSDEQLQIRIKSNSGGGQAKTVCAW